MSIKLNGQTIAKSVLSGSELETVLVAYATTDALSTEVTRATAAETTLTNSLAAEIARAEAAEATKLSTSDTIVTKQGNTFNGASQLVQLNSSGQLPALNGVNLTGLTASQISNASTTFANTTLSNLTLATALTNFGFAGQSFTPNGYYKLPNGLTLQWGTYSSAISAEGTISVTFPVAFSNACLFTSAIVISTGISQDLFCQNYSKSTTGAMFLLNSGYTNMTANGFDWFAIGY